MDKISPKTGDIYPISAAVQVFTKPSVLLNRFRAAARPVRMEDCPMFPDTDLPLALVMEEFLDGKRKKIVTRKKKILQVSNVFLQEIRSWRKIVTSSTDFLNSVGKKDQLTLLLC